MTKKEFEQLNCFEQEIKMEVYCVFMIIHSIEHHVLHSIHKNIKNAYEEAKRKQNEIAVEIIEFYVEKRELEE